MIRRVVVDAGVAVRWLLPGPGKLDASRILVEREEGLTELAAPAIQRAEVANVLWKYVRFGGLPAGSARRMFESYILLAPDFHDSPALARTALDLALTHGRSVYDCLYVALSVEFGCELLTADQRLFRALGPAFPNIRLLALGPTDAVQ